MDKGYIKTIINEPYSHFFLIGIILYIAYRVINPESNLPKKIDIVITRDEIEDINSSLTQTWHHDISSSELDLMVQDRYYDEILLQESIAFELHKRDKIVRDRLIKKMRHIITSTTPKEPTEEQLHDYYRYHIIDYSSVTEISFSDIYFADMQEQETKHLVELLNRHAMEPSKASEFGDDHSGKHQIDSITLDDLSSKYGNYFAKQMIETPTHRWQGGIRSKDGTHIVYIRSKMVSKPIPFDEVEDRVYRDYMRSIVDQYREESYKKLSTQYRLDR